MKTLKKIDKIKISKYMFDYEEMRDIGSIGSAFDYYFSNSDVENCPTTKCQLKTSGCNFNYGGTDISIEP